MSKHFLGPENCIIVATNLDEAFPHVRNDADILAKRTGMRLRFVHAVEPINNITYRALTDIRSLDGIVDAVEESRQLKAEQQISAALGDEIDGDDISVLRGDPVESILAEAMVRRASLIVVGANAQTSRFLPSGFSTALSLITQSKIPVIVSPRLAPGKGAYNINKERIRMLIADDLSNDGQDVVLSALDVARALGNTDVLHLHATALSEDKIRQFLSSAASNDIRNAAEISTLIHKNQEQAVSQRAPERIPLLEARGGTYRYEIVSGDPIDQITHAAASFEADILVFGQHKTLHKKPFSIGKVPFHSMLQQNRLVMVVPARYHG